MKFACHFKIISETRFGTAIDNKDFRYGSAIQ